MARTNGLPSFLTDVAEAIKVKKGDDTPINASDFDNEIENLPSGGDLSEYFNLTPSAESYGGTASIKKLPTIEMALSSSQSSNNLFYFFKNMTGLEETPNLILTGGNVANVTGFCYNCKSLRRTPNYKFNGCPNFSNFFAICSSLTETQNIDLTEATNLSYMYNYCHSLETAQNINAPLATNVSNMFGNCEALSTLKNIRLNSVTNASEMFYNTTSIVDIDGLYLPSVTSFTLEPQSNLQFVKNLEAPSIASGFKFSNAIKEIENVDLSGMTSVYNLLSGKSNLLKVKGFNLSGATDTRRLFYSCNRLTTVKNLDISNATDLTNMFYGNRALISVDEIDASNVTTVSNPFNASMAQKFTAFTDFGGFKDLGRSYSVESSANYSAYTLDLTKTTALSHDSLMNVINNLYDIATAGCNTQTLKLGSTNTAKLTSEELALATSKGWSLS